LTEVWQAVAKTKGATSLLLEFVGKLAVASSAHPGTFSGIINFGIQHVPQLHSHRSALFIMMQEAIGAMSRIMVEFYPGWGARSRAWEDQGRVNLILQRQGFLRLS